MGIIERIVGSRAGTITAKHLTGDGSKLAQAISVNFNRHKGYIIPLLLAETRCGNARLKQAAQKDTGNCHNNAAVRNGAEC